MSRVCNKCSLAESETVTFCKDRNTCVNCRTLYHKQWQQNNAVSYAKYHRQYQAKREKRDPCYKISRYLRKRLASALQDNAKVGSAVNDLGCSVEELKTYLESKFQPGMTWDNWSPDGWHIDHVKPLICFNLTDPSQYKQACHYTNLQPLWAVDNLKKHDKH